MHEPDERKSSLATCYHVHEQILDVNLADLLCEYAADIFETFSISFLYMCISKTVKGNENLLVTVAPDLSWCRAKWPASNARQRV